MFDLGTQELIVIFIVAFLVFGPKKLPELGRTLGRGIRELKAAMRGVKETFEEADADVRKEIKGIKSDLEDSVYKSIEPHFDDKKELKEGAPPARDKEGTSEEEGAKKKETEKDG